MNGARSAIVAAVVLAADVALNAGKHRRQPARKSDLLRRAQAKRKRKNKLAAASRRPNRSGR